MNGTQPRALRARADEDLALAQRNDAAGALSLRRPRRDRRSLGTTMQPQASLQAK